MMRTGYNREELIAGLRDMGLGEGDIVFSHVAPGLLGPPREGASADVIFSLLETSLQEVLGPVGTWVVPTYSYSFMESPPIYDPDSTPSKVGAFTEFFRTRSDMRSADPIFSVAAIGPRSVDLLAGLPHDCFGRESVYGRLTESGAKLCNVGVGFRYATYVHYVEEEVGVPYRFPKYFSGVVREDGHERHEVWLYNVRSLEDPAGLPDLRRFEAEARSRGLVRTVPLGMSGLTCINLSDLYELACECIQRDPWFLARGGATDYTGDRVDQTGRVEFSALRDA